MQRQSLSSVAGSQWSLWAFLGGSLASLFFGLRTFQIAPRCSWITHPDGTVESYNCPVGGGWLDAVVPLAIAQMTISLALVVLALALIVRSRRALPTGGGSARVSED